MKLNVPNKITISRIILIPLIVFFYLADFIPYGIGKFVSAFIFMIAAYTDFLDGYLARKNNQVTNFGKFLDPIADKLIVFSALVLVCVDGTLPHIFSELVLIIMLARDFIVGAIRTVAASSNIVIAADIFGKIKTVLQDIALSILLVYSGLIVLGITGIVLEIFKWAGFVMIFLSAVASVLSGINYCVKNKGVLKDER